MNKGFFISLVSSSIVVGLVELGVSDPVSLVLLTLGFGAIAVRRVLERPRMSRCSREEAWFCGAGVLAWTAIGAAATQSPDGLGRFVVQLPAWAHAGGALLLVAIILHPLFADRTAIAESSGEDPSGFAALEISPETMAYAVALPLVSGSLVLAGLAVAWIVGACALRRTRFGAAVVRIA